MAIPFIVVLTICIIALLFLRIYKAYYKLEASDNMAKDIHITISDSNVVMKEEGFPVETHATKQEEPNSDLPYSVHDKRMHAREPLETRVDFVREGTLFKEDSKDVSFSGIFLKSKAPEKYHTNDFLTIAFQASDGSPQKHSGVVVRKSDTGIGVKFILEDEM